MVPRVIHLDRDPISLNLRANESSDEESGEEESDAENSDSQGDTEGSEDLEDYAEEFEEGLIRPPAQKPIGTTDIFPDGLRERRKSTH